MALLFSLEKSSSNCHYLNLQDKLIFDLVNSCAHIVQKELLNTSFPISFIESLLKSDYIVLVNMGLKLLRFTYTDADIKLKLVLEFVNIYESACKEQTYLLLKDVISNVSKDLHDSLIERIKNGNTQLKEHNLERYELGIYKWSILLTNEYPDEIELIKLKNIYASKYGDLKNLHLERHYELAEVRLLGENCPLNENALLKLSVNQLVEFIRDFKEDYINDFTFEGLFRKIGQTIIDHTDWCNEILNCLAGNFKDNEKMWSIILNDVSKSNISIFNKVKFIRDLIEIEGFITFNNHEVAMFLHTLICNSDNKNEIMSYLNFFYEVSQNIISLENTYDCNLERVIDKCLNCSFGLSLYNLIVLYSMEQDISKCIKYESTFEQLLTKETSLRDQIICLIVGHARFFYANNFNWFTSVIEPLLITENNDDFKHAWEGITYYSSRLYPTYAEYMQNVYKIAAVRVNKLSSETKESFIRQYILISFFTINDQPLDYLKILLCKLDESGLLVFTESVTQCLKDNDAVTRNRLWEDFLCPYLNFEIKHGFNLLPSRACEEVVYWCLYLERHFDKFINLVIELKPLMCINEDFIYLLNESKLIVNYKESVVKLLIFALNKQIITQYGLLEVLRLIDLYGITTDNVNSDLYSALVKNNILL